MKILAALILISCSALAGSVSTSPTPIPQGTFTGAQRVENGELLAEVRLSNGNIVWVVIPK